MLQELVFTFVLPIVSLAVALFIFLGSSKHWPAARTKDKPEQGE